MKEGGKSHLELPPPSGVLSPETGLELSLAR